MQRDHGCSRGNVREEGRGEVKIHHARIVEGLVEGGAAIDLLGVCRIVLAIQRPDKFAVGEVHGFGLIAQAAGPGQQSADRKAVAADLDLGRDHVAGVEAECLHHVQAVGGVVKGHRAGSLEDAGGRDSAGDGDLIEHLVQLFGQLRFIGEERERQAEGGGLWIDQVKLLAAWVGVVLILLALQNPVLHLSAPVGEDDLQILVLNRRFRHGRCGDDRSGDYGSLHLPDGQLRLDGL